MKSNFTFILSIRGFPLCSSKIPLNLTFNRKKTWKQLSKNISPTPLKMPTK